MALRSRFETIHVSGALAASTTVIVSAVALQFAAIYKLIVTTSGTATLIIQDTANNVLSQTFSFGTSGGSITLDIPINNEPWWMSGNGITAGLGLQYVVTGTVNHDTWYLQRP